jgi:CO/xanthine dehydrogenase Mo-binding subunit
VADNKDNKKTLFGTNYTTPDLLAKVMGKAKYAEDYRAPGMLFTKLLLSPMPHARVTKLDTSAAMAMPGVKAILLPDDLPGAVAGQVLGEGVVSTAQAERALTMEPTYEGEPILAIAATSELEAAEAIEKIVIEFEPLPFAVDPVATMRPGSPNARLFGNTWAPASTPGAVQLNKAATQAAQAAAPAVAAGAAAAAGGATAGAPAAGAPAQQPATAPNGAPAANATAAPARGGAAPDGAAAAAPEGAPGGRRGFGRRGAGAGADGAPAAAAADGGAPAAGGDAAAGGRGRGRRGGADGAAPAAGGDAPAAAAAAGGDAPAGGRRGFGRRGGAAADGAAPAGGDAPAAAAGGGDAAGGRGRGFGRRGAGADGAAAAGGGAAAAGAAPAAQQAQAGGAGRGPAPAGRAGAAPGGRGAGRGGAGGGAAAAPVPVELKWTDKDFADAGPDSLPFGTTGSDWSFPSKEAVDEAMKKADLVLDETFVGPSTGHQPLETRTAFSYWQNGKCFIHCSTQSTQNTHAGFARSLNGSFNNTLKVDVTDVVLISEYTGGGFGSKIPGSINMIIPALLSKKAGNVPVMHRITREEEHYIGRARPALTSRVKVGFRKDGKVLAIDGIAISDSGPYNAQGDAGSAGTTISLLWQPEAMRWRSMGVATNTPPKTSQRAPGGMQGVGLIEPIMAKAARKLGIDEVELHRINAPSGKAKYGPAAGPRGQAYVTSCFIPEAITKGVELFNWDEKKLRSGKRVGSKVRGSGMAMSAFSGGSVGFDGLLIIRPDGKVQLQSGIGNHGTHSVFDVHRVAADILGVPFEQCEVIWGDTSKNLPNTCISAGSQTTHAMTRAAHAVGTAAVAQIQAMCAEAWGGAPEAYKVAGGKVTGNGHTITFAQIGKKAIELGGKYDGHEPAQGINAYTARSVQQLAGQGFIAAARDAYPHDGNTQSYYVAFAEVEVDVETGKYQILETALIADVGTVMNPRSLQGQGSGGMMLGIGHGISQKWVYDQHYGVPLAKRFYQNKPVTILDKPLDQKFAAIDLPDPETPVGARGTGEPPVGAGFGAVMNAIAAAVGDEVFRRAPVSADIILTALEAGNKGPQHERLTAHI